MKKVAIIGIGNVGSALGKGLAAKGHTVTYGLRDPKSDKAKAALSKIGPNAKAATVPDAAAASEVIILATPWSAAKEALQSAGNLSGKILVDCINPFTPDLKSLSLGTTTSAAETIASWAIGAQVVKAFNTTGADNMTHPSFGNQRLTMFICGNDANAKKTVSSLAQDIGFDPVDAGALAEARALEPLALLWVHLAVLQKMGSGIALQLIRR